MLNKDRGDVMKVLHNIYFSAKGRTKTCAECISAEIDMETKTYNWLKNSCNDLLEIPNEDVLLFCMPVYGGFIPQICAHMANNLKGNDTPAIIVAVYGNRHYDDALLQMKDILTVQGFKVIAAGAFLAEHSIFPAVATNRPDEKDKAAMVEFAANSKRILATEDLNSCMEIEVPGTRGYDVFSYGGVALKPETNDECIKCGACAKICPQKAINVDQLCEINIEKCISCGACITVCPTGARNYQGEVYQQVQSDFKKKCSLYRKPETYYIVGLENADNLIVKEANKK